MAFNDSFYLFMKPLPDEKKLFEKKRKDYIESITSNLNTAFNVKVVKFDVRRNFFDSILSVETVGKKTVWPRVKKYRVSKGKAADLPRSGNSLDLLGFGRSDVFIITYLSKRDVALLATKRRSYSLKTVLESDVYFRKANSFHLIKTFLSSLLDSLTSVHERGICHLAITTKDVKIVGGNLSAILHCGTIGSLQPAGAVTDKYNVPYFYKPPEAWGPNKKIPVEGIPFDMWCFGILALKIFTRSQPESETANEPTDWWSGVYKQLLGALQEKAFLEICRESFPASKVDKKDVKVIRSFIASCLRLDPHDRPTAAELKKHKYLKKWGGHSLTEDELWEDKVRMSSSNKEGKMQSVFKWIKKSSRKAASLMQPFY